MLAPLAQPLAAVAPLVLPADAAGTAYEGYVAPSAQRAAGRPASLWLRISGLRQGTPSLRGCRLEVNAELAALLEGRHGMLEQRLAESPSLPAFFVELQNMVDQLSLERQQQQQQGTTLLSSSSSSSSSSRPAAFYSSLKTQLEGVGWARVSDLSTDLSQLTLQAADTAGRRHELRLTFPPSYPASAPTAVADLPTAFELRWGPGASLADVLAQFEAALSQHQLAWDSLDDLDQHAWVIEPTAPPRSALCRRIALGNHVSLALALDPDRPSALPLELRFMGSDRAVAPLRQKIHENRGLWEEGRLLRENLQAVLQLALPQRQDADAEDASADCAICYAYRLPAAEGQGAGEEGEAPDINCDNPSCGKPFHRRCLAEWLNSDTSTRQSFNTLFGSCPYCSAPITVKVS